MTRIVFLDYFYSFGGAQKSTATLFNALHQSGRDVIFLAPSDSDERFHRALAVEPVVLGDGDALRHGRASPVSFALQLLATARRVALWAKATGPAFHVTSSVKGLMTLAIARRLFGARFRTAYYSRGEGKAEQFGRFGRWLVRAEADRILCVSRATADNMRAWGVPGARLTVTYTSIDVGDLMEAFATLPRPLETGVPVRVLFAASIIPGKGLDHLLRALARSGSDRPIELAIAGDIPNAGHVDYLVRCRALADELPGHVRTTWLGWVDDVPERMKGVDIVCLPSATEGFPRLIVEAMALGRIVIATPVGGIAELIKDGATGFLIDLDPDSITRAFTRVLEDEEAARRMAAAGHTLIGERYRLEIQANLVVQALS